MKIVTHRVHPDEPCYSLREGPRNVNLLGGGTARHWVQALYVIRGDAMAEFTTDFGPVENWPNAVEIIIPSFGENSVAQLQEIAERDRHDNIGARHRQRVTAESTLISDILRQEETKLDVTRNRSVLGPAVSVQRNDFPREAVKRRRKESRDARHS